MEMTIYFFHVVQFAVIFTLTRISVYTATDYCIFFLFVFFFSQRRQIERQTEKSTKTKINIENEGKKIPSITKTFRFNWTLRNNNKYFSVLIEH